MVECFADTEAAAADRKTTSDNPALQPKDSLEFSLYTVCHRAGKAGLTAREAMSEILVLRELPGVLKDQNVVQSSRRIAKLLRSSPYYMELGEGKFALCTAVIDTELTLGIEHPVITSLPTLHDEPDPGQASLQSEDVSQVHQLHHNSPFEIINDDNICNFLKVYKPAPGQASLQSEDVSWGHQSHYT